MSETQTNESLRPIPERLRDALETLEAIVQDRALLAELSQEDQRRLLDAAGEVWCPDPKARRRLVKALASKRRAERAAREEDVLQETGIREMRRRPTYTTPNVFPPEASEVDGATPLPQGEDLHCYVCKERFAKVHHFYDQLCPTCGDFNFAKRTELADLSGRVALLTGGRVKIGYQAGIKLLRSGAHLIVTTRFPPRRRPTLRSGKRLRRLGPSPGDFRPRLTPHPQRRGVLSRIAESRWAPGLHRQQRLPDGQTVPLPSTST